jgi:hypothetical protein
MDREGALPVPASGKSTVNEVIIEEESVVSAGENVAGEIAMDVNEVPSARETGADAGGGEVTTDVATAKTIGATAGADHPYSPWSVVLVDDVCMELPSNNPVIVLREQDAPWRELRIPVGLAEGNYIAYAMKKVATPRPLVHDLMLDLLERHQVTVEAARIVGVQGKLFLAELETMGPKGRQVIQCRPSDAIALAVRTKMPIPVLVAEWVFVSVYHAGKPGCK